MKRMAILISGRGSNMTALLEAHAAGNLHIQPVLVISNRALAPGLETARAHQVRTEVVSFKDRDAGEGRVLELTRECGVDLVVLAGFMRVISPRLIEAFPQRIINIHPSLLPAFPGLHAQQQAWEYGVRVSGCTTHFVTAGVDSGPIIMQRVVPVREDDTEESLAARILEQEHQALVATVNAWAEGGLNLQGRRVHGVGDAGT